MGGGAGSHYIAQIDLKFVILLPLPSEVMGFQACYHMALQSFYILLD